MNIILKKCKNCKQEKNLEYFYKNKTYKNGYEHTCKICRNERNNSPERKEIMRKTQKKYDQSQKGKEKRANYLKTQKGKESRKKAQVKYSQTLNAKEKKRKREQLPKNRKKQKEKRRKYEKTIEGKASHKRYKQNNPEKIIAYSQNRRAKIENIPGFFTKEDIKQMFVLQEGKCYFCKNMFIPTKKCKTGYHIDHKIPLSRTELNPTNNPENICLACPNCNLRKWNKTVEEFIEYMKQF